MPNNPSSGRHVLRDVVENTASVAFAGNTVSTTAFTVSKGVKAHQWDRVGIWIDISASANAGRTLDITFEVSEDSTNGINGTWAAMRRGTTASQTQAAMNQVTTVTGAYMSPMFEVPVSDKGWIRVKPTVTSGDTYDVDSFYWVFRA